MSAKPFHLIAISLLMPIAGEAIADAEKKYQRGVKDAAFVEASEIDAQLNAISPSNPTLVWNDDKTKVLVTTWKTQSTYENYIKPVTHTSDNPNYAIWVTAVPEVHNLCSHFRPEKAEKNPARYKKAVDRRLKQYLGLDPDWNYDVFVDMWVRPDDIFRPCVDPEINDTSCNLQFGKDIPTVKNIPDYQDFYSDLYFKSYRASEGVPWTGLGYTYDWGNPESDIGASEYILVPGAEYEIHRALPTVEYCANQ